MTRAIAALLSLLLPLAACTSKSDSETQTPNSYYEVASHDAASGEWVFIRVNNEEHSRVQLRTVCDFYKSGDRERVDGRDSCDLRVGSRLATNALRAHPKEELLIISESGDKLFVTRGQGADRIHQQFSVRSATMTQKLR